MNEKSLLDTRFSEEDRRTYAALADVLIPAKDPFPSASEAGVSGTLLDVVLGFRPDLRDGLSKVLSEARSQNAPEFVSRLMKEDSDAFGILAVLVPGAYFMNPNIRHLFGYQGQMVEPIDYEARPEYLEDDLLKPVIDRGAIYRPTPDPPQAGGLSTR